MAKLVPPAGRSTLRQRSTRHPSAGEGPAIVVFPPKTDAWHIGVQSTPSFRTAKAGHDSGGDKPRYDGVKIARGQHGAIHDQAICSSSL